jgi:hypothetical protein
MEETRARMRAAGWRLRRPFWVLLRSVVRSPKTCGERGEEGGEERGGGGDRKGEERRRGRGEGRKGERKGGSTSSSC